MSSSDSKTAILKLIQIINDQQKASEKELATTVEDVTHRLKRSPRPNYSLTDLIRLLDALKNRMVDSNTKAYQNLSQTGIPLLKAALGGGDIGDISIITDSGAQEQIDTLEAEIQERQEAIDKLTEQLEQQTKRLGEQMESVNEKQEELDEIRRAMVNHEAEKTQLNIQIETIGNRLVDAHSRIQDLELAIGDRDEAIKAIQDKTTGESDAKIKELGSRIIRAAEKIEDLTKQLGDKEESIVSLQEEIQQLKDEKSGISSMSEGLSEQFAAMEVALGQAQKELEDGQNELTQYKNKIDELEKHQKEFDGQVGQIKNEKEDIEKKHEDLEVAYKSLEIKYESLETEHNGVVNELSKVKSEVNGKSEKEMEISTRLEALQKELEAKDKTIETEKELYEKVIGEREQIRSQMLENEQKTALMQGKLDERETDIQMWKEEAERNRSKLQEGKSTIKTYEMRIENLKELLEENPKYYLLMIVEDMESGVKIKEIANVTGRPVTAIRRTLQALEDEEWLEIKKGDEIYMKKPFLNVT